MNRIIVITKCAECPHEGQIGARAYCDAHYSERHTGLRWLIDYPNIPDWCPLERAETKGESEDE